MCMRHLKRISNILSINLCRFILSRISIIIDDSRIVRKRAQRLNGVMALMLTTSDEA